MELEFVRIKDLTISTTAVGSPPVSFVLLSVTGHDTTTNAMWSSPKMIWPQSQVPELIAQLQHTIEVAKTHSSSQVRQ